VIANHRVMPDVIAAPQSHVVANGHERLDGVVLEDETVFADPAFVQDRGAGAYIAREGITERLGREILFSAQRVQLRVTQRDEELMGVGWKSRKDVLERHDRQATECLLPRVCGIN